MLEFVKEQLGAGNHKWRLNWSGEITETNYGTKTSFIMEWRVHIWSVSRIETYKVLDVP